MRGAVKIFKIRMGINDREHQAHHVTQVMGEFLDTMG
jgi:hypothetical protein